MKYDKYHVGEKIAEMRNHMNLTQVELIEKCRAIVDADSESVPFSLRTLGSWENGNDSITLKNLILISQALECSVGYLLGEYDKRTLEAEDICNTTGLSEAAVNVLIKNKNSATDNPIAPFISEFILNCDEIMSHICNIIILSHFEKTGAFDEISKIAKGSSEQYRKVTKADGFQIEYIDDVQLERDIVTALKRVGVSDVDIKFLRATTLGFTFDYKKQIDVSMFTLSNSFVEIVKKYVKEGAEDGK